MLTFKEYINESIKTAIGNKILSWATHHKPEPKGLDDIKHQIKQHIKKGEHHKAAALNARIPQQHRIETKPNPWVTGAPVKSSVPGVKPHGYEPLKKDPNVIRMPGPLHPLPKKHQFHN